MADVVWRKDILLKLQNRNRKQCDAFSSLIQAHNKLFESVQSQKSTQIQLNVEIERLRKENFQLQLNAGSGLSSKGDNDKSETVLVQFKLLKLQEELTETHRKKGENAQQIIDLNVILQEKEKICNAKDTKINELKEIINALQDANANVEQSLRDTKLTNQMLTDEQQALQLAYTSVEGTLRRLQVDNNELVTRWMALRAVQADNMNAENEKVLETKQRKLRQMLEEAANEPVKISAPPEGGGLIDGPNVCVGVMIPDRHMHVFEAHEGEVNAIGWSPSAQCFATGGSDRKLKIWKVIGGKCELKGTLTGSNAAFMSVEFDLQETMLLAASNDFACRVWTLADQRLRHTWTGHAGKVLAAKFLGDAAKIVSGSTDRTLRIWDIRSEACIKTLLAASSCHDIVTADGFGSSIISGHFDRNVRFWDQRCTEPTNKITMEDRITSLDISSDHHTLLTCTRDDTLRSLDLRMNKVVKTFCAEGFHLACDWSRAVFSPDSEYVMCGSADGGLYVWNVQKEQIEKVLRKHEHAIFACSWSPAGNSLLSCDKQRTVILWADF